MDVKVRFWHLADHVILSMKEQPIQCRQSLCPHFGHRAKSVIFNRQVFFRSYLALQPQDIDHIIAARFLALTPQRGL